MGQKENSWLTIGEAAALLGVSVNTLRNWDASGKLKAQRHPLNNYRLYRETDVLTLRWTIHQTADRDVPSTDDSTTVVQRRPFARIVKQLNRLYWDYDLDLIARFEEISKLLFCKFVDENLQVQAKKRDKVLSIRLEDTPETLYKRISKLYNDALPEGVDRRGGLIPKHNAIYRAVELLQQVNLADYEEDLKGTTYEEMIRNTFERDENQQYFTPRQLVEFMIEMVNPQPDETICDPACGTGGFLVQTLKKIQRDLYLEGTPDVPGRTKEFSKKMLRGVEIDSRIAWIAQMNCHVHGGAASSVSHLPNGGSLAFDNGSIDVIPDNSMDVIVTNPPFGSDYADSKNLSKYVSGRGKSSARRGVLFVERCLRVLKPGGKMAIIVDDGILNSLSNSAIRSVILEKSIVQAVISLPEEMFKPYASVKSSVLFLRKRASPEQLQPNVFMSELERVGKSVNGRNLATGYNGQGPSPMLLSDFPKVLDTWQRFQLGRSVDSDCDGLCFVTDLDLGSSNPSKRLDTTFHHPSKQLAKKWLEESKFPIFALNDLFRVRRETIVPAKSNPDDEIPYVGLANIEKDNGQYTITKVRGNTIRSTVRRFDSGNILFSKMRPQLRKTVLARHSGYCSSECVVLRPRANSEVRSHQRTLEEISAMEPVSELNVDPEFVSILLRSDLVFGQIIHELTGIGRPRVSSNAVMKIRIPLPPLETQRLLVNEFRQLQGNSIALRRQSEQLLKEAKRMLRSAHEDIAARLSPREG